VKRYLRGASDETLEETYGYFSKRMPRLPYPAVEAVNTALEMMADQFPQASSVDPKKSSMRHSLSKSKPAAVENRRCIPARLRPTSPVLPSL
jgi:hypothetical protein